MEERRLWQAVALLVKNSAALMKSEFSSFLPSAGACSKQDGFSPHIHILCNLTIAVNNNLDSDDRPTKYRNFPIHAHPIWTFYLCVYGFNQDTVPLS